MTTLKKSRSNTARRRGGVGQENSFLGQHHPVPLIKGSCRDIFLVGAAHPSSTEEGESATDTFFHPTRLKPLASLSSQPFGFAILDSCSSSGRAFRLDLRSRPVGQSHRVVPNRMSSSKTERFPQWLPAPGSQRPGSCVLHRKKRTQCDQFAGHVPSGGIQDASQHHRKYSATARLSPRTKP